MTAVRASASIRRGTARGTADLWRAGADGTSGRVTLPPRIFDQSRRAARRDRYWRQVRGTPDFHRRITEDLLDRVDSVTRPLATALLINPSDPALGEGLGERDIDVVEVQSGAKAARVRGVLFALDDAPGLPAGPFDLVMSAGGLESVNDVPGALSLFRRALRPDGLLLACLPGSGSFGVARDACLGADLAIGGAATARFHPLVDVRSLGDLAARAGLVLPVAEVDSIDLRYRTLPRLFADLRDHGWAQALAGPMRPLSRRWLAEADALFRARADADGRVAERLNLLTLTAWSPGPDQPKPAARGSGKMSLTRAVGISATRPPPSTKP